MSSQIDKKRYQKRFRIGVRFDGATFVLLNGEPLPALAKNSVAELVLSPESIQDENIRSVFDHETGVPLLERRSSVLLGVSPSVIENISASGLIPANAIPIQSEYVFVRVDLKAKLWLQVRGDQEARLSACRCRIPALEKEARSLNHAFLIISEAYETKRRSHSGNVFERAYAQDRSGNWKNLDELRLQAIQKTLEERTSDGFD